MRPTTDEQLQNSITWITRQKEYLAHAVLTMDPANEKARAELNLPKSFAAAVAAPAPPPPPPSPRIAPDDGETVKKVSAIAVEVVKKYKAISDVVYQMRDRTAGLVYSGDVPVPERFSHIAAMIREPLAFKVIDLSREKAVTISDWWNGLDWGNREDFARFFGLWCVSRRSGR